MTQTQVQEKKAFNLIIEGVGYLNRLRYVTPKKGEPYKACTINAMMGTEDSVEYVSIDCRIVGKQAQEAAALLYEAVKAKKKVIVGFRASDPKPDFYEYQEKQYEGLKARVLQFTFAKVDGEKFEIPLVERAATHAPAQQPSQPAPEHRQQRERVLVEA